MKTIKILLRVVSILVICFGFIGSINPSTDAIQQTVTALWIIEAVSIAIFLEIIRLQIKN